MNKKVLIISGSPRRNGNSEMLGNEFAAGAVSAGHQVEKISLAGKKIGFCTACYGCRANSCPQQDDAPAIIEKMLELKSNSNMLNISTLANIATDENIIT